MYRNARVSRCGAAFAVALFWIVLGSVPLPASAQTPTVVASVDSSTLSESADRVNVRLTLVNPPASGGYTGCRLRLGAGSSAQSPADVTFSNQKKLRLENGWTAQAGLMTVG